MHHLRNNPVLGMSRQLLRAPAMAAARSSGAVRGAAVRQLSSVNDDGTLPQDAFYIVNLAHVVRQHERWLKEMPRVTPYYAVKCNGNRKILETLASLGCGFDCASPAEIESVSELVGPGGVVPPVIYANPCKQISHMEYATDQAVGLTTFDSEEELEKIAEHMPHSKALLRLLPDDSDATCQFGLKYGAPIEDAKRLLARSIELGVEVTGVSYHVGSGNYSTAAYSGAVEMAREAFDMAADLGIPMTVLDLGGGYPGDVTQRPEEEAAAAVVPGMPDTESKELAFEAIAAACRTALDEHFPPEDTSVQIIAEPGRYYVHASHMLLANVIGRKASAATAGPEGGQEFKYYINDGIYGSFNCLLYDHAVVHPRPLKGGDPLLRSSVWGQTCDGLDCVSAETMLPELEVGDWLAFDNMGAYTTAACSSFNGFAPAPVSIYTYDGEIIAEGDALVRCDTAEALIDRLLDESPAGPKNKVDEKATA